MMLLRHVFAVEGTQYVDGRLERRVTLYSDSSDIGSHRHRDPPAGRRAAQRSRHTRRTHQMNASAVSRARIARRQAATLGLQIIQRSKLFELHDTEGHVLAGSLEVVGGIPRRTVPSAPAGTAPSAHINRLATTDRRLLPALVDRQPKSRDGHSSTRPACAVGARAGLRAGRGDCRTARRVVGAAAVETGDAPLLPRRVARVFPLRVPGWPCAGLPWRRAARGADTAGRPPGRCPMTLGSKRCRPLTRGWR